MKPNAFCYLLALAKLACVLAFVPTAARADDRLVGVWVYDEGWQITEFTFRSDGRYQLDSRSVDSSSDFSSSERGVYSISGNTLATTSYEFIGGELQKHTYRFQRNADALSLTRTDFELPEVIYVLKAGSREDVLAREQVEKDLIGTWSRNIAFWGRGEYTFRPGGYYFIKSTPESAESAPEYIRGRYTFEGNRLKLTPYSGVTVEREVDFFGDTLTLIRNDQQMSGDSFTYAEVPGSEEQVRAKAAEAEAFLAQTNWQVGLWEIRDGFWNVDLTIRPDGYYTAQDYSEFLKGIVRGRYVLQNGQIQFLPFTGQGIYSRSNGDFGTVDRTRELDYYDGELQIIDPGSLSQSVALARRKAGSQAAVIEKVRQAQLERQREGWPVGIWEVNDPSGWMEFTFRPDNRYIAKSGTAGVPSQVERGQYKLGSGKITLAPYPGLGQPRGFEYDLYDDQLFLVGDSHRMVIARKRMNSEAEVIEKTKNPAALKGERGSILGKWTADMPGVSEELVFRPDCHFRLSRCSGSLTKDYGLYTVNLQNRTAVYDSRFRAVENLSLDFYGATLTLYGGQQAPRTYKVNPGTVEADIQESLAADAIEAQEDAQWLARIQIGPRNPNFAQIPIGNIPADPLPAHVFESSTAFTTYQLYRRLIPSFVYFNVNGEIRSVAVTNTREWHFFPNGRVLVRFKNYHAGAFWPTTVEEVSDNWGAYHVDPKPAENDILHVFADNGLLIETDLGEVADMTLEDGRRHLFWEKDYQIQYEWAAEQKAIPCQLPGNNDPSLVNVGVSLSTGIPADPLGEAGAVSISITRLADGNFSVTGAHSTAGSIVIEAAAHLTNPVTWRPVQTNSVSPGTFTFNVARGGNKSGYFRVRAQ